jgi:dihydroorotate dehydrogenase electron transfer subunit
MPANRLARLVSREALDGAYSLLTFAHPEVAHETQAGQFVMIKAGTSPEPPLRRPFSIMTVDREAGTFQLFLKEVGPGSRALCALGEGDPALCLGPLGRPFVAPSAGVEALLVAGGYGIAPFHLFVDALAASRVSARVFYGGRTRGDLQARSSFGPRGVPVVEATEDGSLGYCGRVTGALEAYLDAGEGKKALYACGPEGMLHAVARVAEGRGLPCQVSLDPWMGCGVGTCLSCVVTIRREGRTRYRPACTEGPVFDAAAVVWPGDPA